MATPIIFKFVLNQMQDLVDAASVVASADDMADMKFSREMFAIMADSYPALGGVIALHLWPQFFDEYVCNELLKSWTFVKNLFPLMIDMEESGFNSLTFTVTYPESAELKFQAPNGYLLTYFFHFIYLYIPFLMVLLLFFSFFLRSF